MRSLIEARRLAAGVLGIAALALAATPGTCRAAGQLAPAAASAATVPKAAPETERQAQARSVMMKMAQFLAGVPRFRVSLRSGYDAVQPSGQKIEFIEDRTVTVNRPGRLRIEAGPAMAGKR